MQKVTKVTLGVKYDNKPIKAEIGTAVAAQQLTVTDPNGAKTMTREPIDIATIALEPTLPGSYTASLQAQDKDGNPLGDPVTDTFVVAEVPMPIVTISLPTALSAAVPELPRVVEPTVSSRTPDQPGLTGVNRETGEPTPATGSPQPFFTPPVDPEFTRANRLTGEPVIPRTSAPGPIMAGEPVTIQQNPPNA